MLSSVLPYCCRRDSSVCVIRVLFSDGASLLESLTDDEGILLSWTFSLRLLTNTDREFFVEKVVNSPLHCRIRQGSDFSFWTLDGNYHPPEETASGDRTKAIELDEFSGCDDDGRGKGVSKKDNCVMLTTNSRLMESCGWRYNR